MSVPLREALVRVRDATPEEIAALLVDLRYEKACVAYRLEHAKARVAVLQTILRVLDQTR